MTPEVSLHTDPAVDEVLRTVESWPVESVRALQNRLNTLYPPKDHLSTDLPWELIEHVLSFITSPVTLGKLARVSRVWNYWIHCTSAWRRLFLLAQSVDPETLERLSLSVVSPSSSAPTITRNPDAILTIDEITWKEIYRQALLINENWSSGLCSASDFQAHSETVYCMDFDSSCIMTGSRDESLKVWDRCDKRLIRAYQGHSGSVLCLTFNEKYLITGSSDHSILIWSRDTLKPTPLIYRIQDAHSDSVLSLSVTSDPVETAKELLISSSKNGSIRIWSLPEASLKQTLIGHRSAVNACDCHSGFIVSASGDRTLRVWDLRSGNTLRSLVGHERGVACVSFNDRLVVSGSSDFTIRIWDFNTGDQLRVLTKHTDLVRTVKFDGRRIVSGSYDGSICCWDANTGDCLFTLKYPNSSKVFRVQFDFSKLVACFHDGIVATFDFGKGLALAPLLGKV